MTSAAASACSGEVEAGSPTRTCANERIRAANRANAARSTGPRTRAGKAAVARNALRHGLSLPVLADPTLAAEVAALATRIAGEGASAARRAAAVRIAEAQVDVLRVRGVRDQIMAEGFAAADPTARLMRLDRYERRALSRRKAAIKAFDALQGEAAPRRRRDPWAAVAAAAGLRGFWQNKPDFAPVRRSSKRKGGCTLAPRRRRNPWAAVAAAAGLRGLWQNKPDCSSTRRKGAPVRRSPEGQGGCTSSFRRHKTEKAKKLVPCKSPVNPLYLQARQKSHLPRSQPDLTRARFVRLFPLLGALFFPLFSIVLAPSTFRSSAQGLTL